MTCKFCVISDMCRSNCNQVLVDVVSNMLPAPCLFLLLCCQEESHRRGSIKALPVSSTVICLTCLFKFGIVLLICWHVGPNFAWFTYVWHVGIVSLKFASHHDSVWHEIAWWFCGMMSPPVSRSVVVFIWGDVEFYEILCSVAWAQGPSTD